MRNPIPVVISLFLAIAPVASATGLAVNVEGRRLNPETNVEETSLQVVNDSGKDVTGYSVVVTATYADGKVVTDHRDSDMVGLENEDAVLHPGGARHDIAGFRSTPDGQITSIQAEVAAVIYSDNTAEVYEPASFDRLVEHRVNYAKAARLTIDAINRAIADPGNPHPIQDVLDALRPKAEEPKSSSTPDAVVIYGLGAILKNLEALRPQNDPGLDAKNLKAYAARLEHQATRLEEQSKITKVN